MRQLEFLFFFLITGYAFRKTPWSRVHAAGLSRLLNQWVIRAALPALVLLKIHALPEFSFSRPELYLPASQPWLQLALAYLVLSALQGPLKWSRKAWGALVLTVGLGNTSFVGFPLLNALLGPDAIPTGIIIDQLGSFLLLSLVGVPFAQAQQGFASKSRWWWLRPLRFPAFQALLVALLLRGVAFPGFFEKSLDAVAATLSPAALLSVGMMLSFGRPGGAKSAIPSWSALRSSSLFFRRCTSCSTPRGREWWVACHRSYWGPCSSREPWQARSWQEWSRLKMASSLSLPD